VSVIKPAVILAVVLALSPRPAQSQSESAWSVDESLQGSFNSSGQIFRIDSRVSYRLTDHFEAGAGLPVYLVRASDVSDPLGEGWSAGLGNVYLDLLLGTGTPDWYLSTGITAAAPTGDEDRGFSTGRVSVDWNSSVAFYIPGATLFGSAGVGNSVSDTSFFVRPFVTTGLVGHSDGGVFIPLSARLGLGALGYVVAGGGEQRVRSRLVQTDRLAGTDRRRGFETTVETRGQDLADDHGFSAWLDISGRAANFQAGYTRSVPYAYDTVFFAVVFDVISLVR